MTLVPPFAFMLATIDAWSACAAAARCFAWVRRFRLECWFFSTTITWPPDAAPPNAGAMDARGCL
ncbi:MAG TPA: hypothetical protein VF482_19050, partial [Trebonia sp.]